MKKLGKEFGSACGRNVLRVTYLPLELDLLFIVVWRIPFCEPGFASRSRELV